MVRQYHILPLSFNVFYLLRHNVKGIDIICSPEKRFARTDFKASINYISLQSTPVEIEANTLMFLRYFNSIPYVKASSVVETGSSSLGSSSPRKLRKIDYPPT
jgi:hypothetical protein